MTNKLKRNINLVLKISILLFAFIAILRKLSNNTNLENFKKLISDLPQEKVIGVLLLVFSLMFVNWLIEAFKWQFLMKDIQPISFRKAVESVFCGLTLAVFTPNRIGEYGGRVFFLSPGRRILGAIAMGVGSVGQMVITNVLGAIAILFFICQYIKLNAWLYLGVISAALLYSSFFLLLFFNVKPLLNFLLSFKIFKSLKKFFTILSRYSKQKLLVVFMCSLLRFMVFTFQYCLVLTLLIPEIPKLNMVMMLLILFFIQSILPSLDLLDVGVRTITATYLFHFITRDNDVAIMASTASIWLINLIIPAILGSVFVFKLNIFGTPGN